MKKVILTAMAGLSLLSIAEAQTVIHITGSTAYRANTHFAIMHILGGTPNPGTPTTLPAGSGYAYTGASLSGANQGIFKGTVSGNAVIIETSWSGSAAGIQTVAGGLPVAFLDDSTAVSTTGIGSTAAGVNNQTPDVAMADNYQSSTDFRTPILTDTIVGVVPFRWLASPGAPFTNLTTQLAQALFGNGTLSLAQFTGVHADQQSGVDNMLFAVGRDPDSGTRVATFAESGIGALSIVYQWLPTTNTTTGITDMQYWPAETINGILYPQGDSGYHSGGPLAQVIRKTLLSNGTSIGNRNYCVTYVGISDANTALGATGTFGNPATELTWNGNKLEAGTAGPYTSVLEGKYTFWSYEHLMYRSTLTGTKKTVADALASKIALQDAQILTTDMQVVRSGDGGLVTQNY